MASSGSFATNIFPARNLRKPIQQDGAWLVAFKAEQRGNFQGLISSKKTASNLGDKKFELRKVEPLKPISCPQQSAVSDKLSGRKKFEDRELNRFFLHKHCAVDDPKDLCSVNIESCGLGEVRVDDLLVFDNAVFVKASDNMLSLEAMRYFPKVKELSMSLNAIRGVQLQVTDFPYLEVLDLSFNNLSPDDIKTIGLLRNLRVMTASGNNLHYLPLLNTEAEYDDGRKTSLSEETDDTQSEQDFEKSRQPGSVELFPRLEVFNLDNNRFADEHVFLALATLRRLKVLNLDKNEIKRIPHIQVVNGKAVIEDNSSKKKRRQSARKPKFVNGEIVQHADSRPATQIAGSTRNHSRLDAEDTYRDAEQHAAAQVMASIEQQITKIEPPFCELTTLSLAGNPIVHDADLLALIGWPLLQRIVLINTPLVNTTSGDTTIIRKVFKERLGMQIVRKQNELQVAKPRVEIRRDKPERLNIKMEVIPIPKCDVDKLLAASNSLMSVQDAPADIQPKAAITQVSGAAEQVQAQAQAQAQASSEQVRLASEQATPQSEPFFVTQPEHLEEDVEISINSKPSTAILRPSAKSTAKRTISSKSRSIFDDGGWKTDEELRLEQGSFVIDDLRFRGYEDILKGIPSERELDTTLPKDMNSSVAALRYSLQHPMLLDSDTHLDKIVRPYNMAKTKVLPNTRETAAQIREKRIEKAYAALRNNKTIDTIPLTDVLKEDPTRKHDSKAARDRKNAKIMFDKMNKHYEKVREVSLQHAFESLEKVSAEIDEMRQSIQKNILRLTEERAEDRKHEIEQLESKLSSLETASTSPTSAVSVFMNKVPRSHVLSQSRQDS